MNNILALDIGEKRIGVARANAIARIAVPVATLHNDDSFLDNLKKIITEYEIDVIVVGLPRGLHGNETKQSEYTRLFVQKNMSDYAIIWQDETLSTVTAAQSKPSGRGIDADAACIIVEDYLTEQHEV